MMKPNWIGHRAGVFAACVVALLAFAAPADACRYSVRDVTFVNLMSYEYSLALTLPGGRDRAFADELKVVAGVALADSSITGISVSTVAEVDAKAGSAILHAPDGTSIDLAKRFTAIDLDDEKAVWKFFTGLVNSPVRARIKDELFTAHSVIVLVESKDAAVNERARAMATDAIKQIDDNLDELPKPPPRGPALVVVKSGNRAAEHLLLASLGLDELDDNAAAMVVLSGRMRRVGAGLVVPGTVTRELLNHLHVIGADCECGLDRSWMQGVPVPHAWTADDEKRVFDSLGFDPGNPLVQSEIARILTRGPNGNNPNPLGLDEINPAPVFDEYQEIVIDDFEIDQATGEALSTDGGANAGSDLALAGPSSGELNGGQAQAVDSIASSAPAPKAADAQGLKLGGVAAIAIISVAIVSILGVVIVLVRKRRPHA